MAERDLKADLNYLGQAEAHADEGPLGEPAARSILKIAMYWVDRYDARVTELLEANNLEVARRRQAEGGALVRPLLGCGTLGEAIEALELLEHLRQDEGNMVSLICDNPDFGGGPNAIVEMSLIFGEQFPQRMSGDTVLECLRSLKAVYDAQPDVDALTGTADDQGGFAQFQIIQPGFVDVMLSCGRHSKRVAPACIDHTLVDDHGRLTVPCELCDRGNGG